MCIDGELFLPSKLIIFCITQCLEATVVSGSGTEAGQIIKTTVAGRNGQQKQVIELCGLLLFVTFACVIKANRY